MTYSVDFRRKVLSIREKEGLTMKEVASRFDVGIATVMRWVKRVVPQANRNKPATKIDMEALAKDVEENPHSYQYETAGHTSFTCLLIHPISTLLSTNGPKPRPYEEASNAPRG